MKKKKGQQWRIGYQQGRAGVIEEIEKEIVAEILICRKENTPTSRLTSLYNKVGKMKWHKQ